MNSTVPSLAIRPVFRCRPTFILALAGAFLLAGCNKGPEAVTKPRVAGADAGTGKRLVTQYQCGTCHVIPDVQGAGGDTGPSLEHVARLSYIAGRIPNRPDNMVAWLRNPPALKPGTIMPAMGISEQEARHMAAYLYTLE